MVSAALNERAYNLLVTIFTFVAEDSAPAPVDSRSNVLLSYRY